MIYVIVMIATVWVLWSPIFLLWFAARNPFVKRYSAYLVAAYVLLIIGLYFYFQLPGY